MEFFDKLGKKASETYQEVKVRTTNFSEEMKLKSKINDLKGTRSACYTEMGKHVYNDIKDNKDVDRAVITEKCDEITKLTEEIEKLEAELASYSKTRKCAACGAKMDTEYKFCPKCGQEQPQVAKEEPAPEVKEEDTEVQEAKEADVIIENNEENEDKKEEN